MRQTMSKEEKLKIEEYCLLNCSKAQMINKYIEALEINEEHQKLNGELREECKQLKESTCKCSLDGLVCLENEIKRLEEENNRLRKDYAQIVCDNVYEIKLEQENKQLKEMIDEQDGCNKRRLQIFDLKDKLCKELKNVKNLKQENKQLKDNWNKLEEYVVREIIATDNEIYGTDLLNKMQELEKSVSDE